MHVIAQFMKSVEKVEIEPPPPSPRYVVTHHSFLRSLFRFLKLGQVKVSLILNVDRTARAKWKE